MTTTGQKRPRGDDDAAAADTSAAAPPAPVTSADGPPAPPPSLAAVLANLPSSWDGVKLSKKKRGCALGFGTFASVAARAAADAAVAAAPRVAGKAPSLRDDRKRPRVAPAAERDVRDAVTPLWRVPYRAQLAAKLARVRACLGAMADRCPGRPPPPAPVGVLRSPQATGYRNKCEFTVGPAVGGGAAVGFSLGAYRDGVVEVGPPGGCPNVSAAAVTLAAAAQAYVRAASRLPAWDKRVGAGFWRALTVREGRRDTYLPPPGASDGAPVPPCPAFGDLDVTPWLVPAADLEGLEEAGAGGGGSAVDGAAARPPPASSAEPPPPPPDEVMVIIQVDPNAAPREAAGAELGALARALAAACASAGLPGPRVWVQHHSGVSNAADPGAPLAPLAWDGEDRKGEGAGDAASHGAGAVEGGGGAAPAPRQPSTTPAPPTVAPESACIEDTLAGLRFRVSPDAFFQTNSGGATLLYRLAVSWAAPGPTTSAVLDVCCGTGTLGVAAAAAGARRVVGVDICEGAVADARVNAAANGLANCEFVADRAEAVMDQLLASAGGARGGVPGAASLVAIVDPPGAGLHPKVTAALRACPALHRVVYVSCNPETLAADGARLCCDGGRGAPFAATKAAAVDLFPHTAHCEAVVCFDRGGGGG